jgi:ABC-type microcin C transport system permease subunit YejB
MTFPATIVLMFLAGALLVALYFAGVGLDMLGHI